MNATLHIVDDDVDTAELMRAALKKHGYDVEVSYSAKGCLDRLRAIAADVVVTDVRMPDMTGIELCQQLRDRFPDLLTIVITGESALDSAIAAIRAGAYDFITKPVKADVLAIAVARAVEHLSVKREVTRLRDERKRAPQGGIAGTSPAIRETIEMISRVAGSDASVLITGESGTGKELVARALHDQSSRANEPFIAINCAAMPAPLLESELFGHARGAFTDAKFARQGLFVQAGAGTIFLDEVGEMPIEMQVKLLRVLQERKVRPVGDDVEIAVKARVVTATNRDLEAEVFAKRFREDLFYRINVVPIAVPPLRDRAGDVLLLAQFFLDRAAARLGKPVRGITVPAARLLADYDWPGNVRELENCMERAIALCRLDAITIDDLPAKLREQDAQHMVVALESPSELITLDELGGRYVRRVLGAVNGNKTRAAKILGIDRRSLYRRLEGPAAGEAAAAADPEPEHGGPASDPEPSAG